MAKYMKENKIVPYLVEIAELKQQLADLRLANSINQGLFSSLQKDNENMKLQLEKVAYVMGEYFIALDPKMSSLVYNGYAIRLPKKERLNYFTKMQPKELASKVSDFLALGAYEPSLEVDNLKECIHMFMQTPKGKVVYSVNYDMLHSCPAAFLKQHVSSALAHVITKEFDSRGF